MMQLSASLKSYYYYLIAIKYITRQPRQYFYKNKPFFLNYLCEYVAKLHPTQASVRYGKFYCSMTLTYLQGETHLYDNNIKTTSRVVEKGKTACYKFGLTSFFLS